jgi:hypothetical protein
MNAEVRTVHRSEFIVYFSPLEVSAAIGVAAVAINFDGIARAFTRRAAIFTAFRRRTAAGGVLTDFLILIVRHLYLPPMNLNCRLFG